MLTDDVTGLYDCSSTSTLEVAVRPKRDMDAEVFEQDAKNEQEQNANDGAAAKKILQDNDDVSNEDVEITRLIGEGRNIARGEKQRLK